MISSSVSNIQSAGFMRLYAESGTSINSINEMVNKQAGGEDYDSMKRGQWKYLLGFILFLVALGLVLGFTT